MTNVQDNPAEPSSLAEVVSGFLEERLLPKVEELEKKIAKAEPEQKEELEQKLEKVRAKFIPQHWIADAARRVAGLQLVTHAVKFIHSSAKGSSLRVEPTEKDFKASVVSTRSLKHRVDELAARNAADLDVFKFLLLEFENKTFLERVLDNSDDLEKLFKSYNKENGKSWLDSFGEIVTLKEDASCNSLVKQLYFPILNNGYHLVAPLYPSTLVHSVYESIQTARFSDETKKAREARKNKVYQVDGYMDFPNLAQQNFGGTKPQNISYLNSRRGGKAYLLNACPPSWRSASLDMPWKVRSVFPFVFQRRGRVRELVVILAKFLSSTDYNNMHIRKRRAQLVEALADEVVQMSYEYRALEPGWSKDERCRLDEVEIAWLDPSGRESLASLAWAEQVAERFGHWLNQALRYHSAKFKPLEVGTDEFQAWADVVEPLLIVVGKDLADA